MTDRFALSPRRARIARATATFFLLAALVSLAGAIAASMYPGLNFRCGSTGCLDRTNLIAIAPDDAKEVLVASPEARTIFARHVAHWPVRLGLASANLIDALPFALLMAAVGLALRKLAARRGNDLAGAGPWLRRGAFAALGMAVSSPIADSLRAMILSPGTPAGPMWYFEIEFVQLMLNLLLAGAVIAVVWTLDAGDRAEREVASFV